MCLVQLTLRPLKYNGTNLCYMHFIYNDKKENIRVPCFKSGKQNISHYLKKKNVSSLSLDNE